MLLEQRQYGSVTTWITRDQLVAAWIRPDGLVTVVGPGKGRCAFPRSTADSVGTITSAWTSLGQHTLDAGALP